MNLGNEGVYAMKAKGKATSMSVHLCNCGCKNVVVLLHGNNGKPFAMGTVKPGDAKAFAQRIVETANEAATASVKH